MPPLLRQAALLAAFCAMPVVTDAHVPWLEETDFSTAHPYLVENVANSKSIHAQLGTRGDIDVYRIALPSAQRIYLSTTIPYCPQYRTFSVTFALVGPGLPISSDKLPFTIPPGSGAVVVRNPVADPDARELWLEPFSGTRMWLGPDYALDPAPAGTYDMIVWNEANQTGDYIAVIGEEESFGEPEMAQVSATSPKLREGRNLMVDCDPGA